MTHRLSHILGPAIVAGALICAATAHAKTFISPMGEPFRGAPDGADPAESWFVGADKNGDGRLTRAEFLTDAGRFFMALDVNHDREIGPEEIDRYEQDISPEVQTGGFGDMPAAGGHRRGGGGHGHGGGGGGGGHRGGGGGEGGGEQASESSSSSTDHPGPSEPAEQGAARFGYLALPEPVTAADTDFNRGVSPAEFAAAANQRFDLLDTNHDGVITRDDLAALRHPTGQHRHGGKHGAPVREGGPD